MTAMQRIELCLVNLGYIYTKPYEHLIKAHRINKSDNTYHEIIVKKVKGGYYIMSDDLLNIYKCVSIVENTATDVIRVIKLMNDGRWKSENIR